MPISETVANSISISSTLMVQYQDMDFHSILLVIRKKQKQKKPTNIYLREERHKEITKDVEYPLCAGESHAFPCFYYQANFHNTPQMDRLA